MKIKLLAFSVIFFAGTSAFTQTASITTSDTGVCNGTSVLIKTLSSGSGSNTNSVDFSSGRYVRIAVNPTLCNFSTFTCEFWYYQTGFDGGDERIVGTEYFASGWTVCNDWSEYEAWMRDNSGSPTTWYGEGGGTPVTQGVWKHFAITHDGSTFRFFIDGNLIYSEDSIMTECGPNDKDIVINRHTWSSGSSSRLHGQLDELRISDIARYTTNFTPPLYEFTNDANTRGLWHFNEGSGVTSADYSGNNNIANYINGAGWSTNIPFTSYSQPVTYQWSTGDSSANITVQPTTTTTYYCTFTIGGTPEIDSVTIFVSEPSANILTQDISCAGNADGQASVSVTGGFSPILYDWSTGDTLQTITNLDTGNFTIIVIDSLNCTDTAYFTISQPFPLELNMTHSDETCAGRSDGRGTANASGGTTPYQYYWFSGDTTHTISNLGPGTYYVTVTDSNGCQTNDSVAIVAGITVSAGSITGSDTVIFYTDENYVAGGYTGTTYQWLVSGGNISSGQGTDSVVIAWSAAGTGELYFISAEGSCTDTTSILVTIFDNTGIRSINADNIRIYPNPTTGLVTIITDEEFEIQLLDIRGRLILSENIPEFEKYIINLSNYHNGIYILKFRNKNSVFFEKIIKK